MADALQIIFSLLLLFITPVGNFILILLLEILLSTLSYFTSPFSLYRQRYSLTQTIGYKIYSRLRPKDRRSRAIFCIIYSLPLAIGVGFFFWVMNIIISEHWVMSGSNISMIISVVSIFIVLVAFILAREYGLKKLADAGYIKVVDLP